MDRCDGYAPGVDDGDTDTYHADIVHDEVECPLCECLNEVARLKASLQGAEDEVNRWKDASGLECGGDPSEVTPEAAAKYWEAAIEGLKANILDAASLGYRNGYNDREVGKGYAPNISARKIYADLGADKDDS